MKKKNKILGLFLFLILLAPSVFAINETISDTPKSLWLLIQNPVCGSDSLTYQNHWFADNAGVSWTNGACGKESNNLITFARDNLLLVGIIFVGIAIVLKKK